MTEIAKITVMKGKALMGQCHKGESPHGSMPQREKPSWVNAINGKALMGQCHKGNSPHESHGSMS
jgi:hypothetical protein